MIVENKYMGYDYERHEYYLKEQALIELTPLHDSEIKQAFKKLKQTLQLVSQRVYAYIYSKNRTSNRKHIHFKIYQNSQGERQAVLDAMIQYAMGAWHNDMDLNAYHDEQKSDFPFTAHDVLRNAKLFNLPTYDCDIKYGDF